MGKRINAIQRKSYFRPSQKDLGNSNKLIESGLKQTTVAILKAVNMNKYIMNSCTTHCIVFGTLQLMSIINLPYLNKECEDTTYCK